jgi:hypothetical protein
VETPKTWPPAKSMDQVGGPYALIRIVRSEVAGADKKIGNNYDTYTDPHKGKRSKVELIELRKTDEYFFEKKQSAIKIRNNRRDF